MHIVLMASGTRGDVQPMIALGLALKTAGHHVRLVAGSNFVQWIESYGLDAYASIDMEAAMQSELGIKWVEAKSQLDGMKYMRALLNRLLEPTVEHTIKGTEGADFIVAGFVSEPFIQAISEKRGTLFISAALQPYRPSHSGPNSILAPLPRNQNLLNYWAGRFAQRMTWRIAETATNALRQRLNLPPHTASSYLRSIVHLPALYAISPHVVPPSSDTGAYTTGYWFLDEPFTPPDDLVHFLDAGDAPVYVGFGSMSSSDPTRTLSMVSEALARVGRRGVLAKGWSGAQMLDVPDHLFVLDKAPHSWLFPQIAAVVHHGGAGTTAAGLRAGKPTLIVPHMADQPFWARRVEHLGVGVKPLNRHNLSVASLAASLQTLLSDKAIADQASALGEAIRAEHGIDNALQWLDTYLAKQKR